MSEVTQTITVGDGSGREGNCLQAAVASLFSMPLDDVPHFIEAANWFGALADFARVHGFLVEYKASTVAPVFGLALGQSARGVTHVVVYRDRNEVWDPHPSRSGLESIEAFIHFWPGGEGD